jgi:hypothetical protein
MISVDVESLPSLQTIQFGTPLLESPNDSQHLLVINLVVELRGTQSLRVIRHWEPIPTKELRENSSYSPSEASASILVGRSGL